MDEKNKKEGVTVKELEGYAKNYRYEIFFCALFIFATIFSLVFWGAYISILLAGIGGIVGVLISGQIEEFQHKMATKILSKDTSIQLIIALLAIIIAIFLAPVFFLCVGLNAGKGMIRLIKKHQQ